MSTPYEDGQLYLALLFLLSNAVLVVYLGSKRLLQQTIKMKNSGTRPDDVMSTSDAMALPLMGSMVLFTLYVILKFIPLEYFNAIISLYLSLVGIFSMGSFIKGFMRPNILTGIACCIVGGYYYWTNNWVANNILAISIGVLSIEMVQIGSFSTSFVMLLGLFFYDIFWVFGSDVMITVASGINGPIKLVFPRTVFENQEAKSLLGLGDLIIPGFFIAQVLVFSTEYVKKGNFYFYVSLIAYTLSLVNTMAVMIIFEHGQPALLFIVPWLLVTFVLATIIKGDFNAAMKYTSSEVIQSSSKSTEKKKDDNKSLHESLEELSLTTLLWSAIQVLFGLKHEEEKEKEKESQENTEEKKNN
ncbi:putative signal peptide peptidase, putative,aspartic peptidase, clan AD, family A22B [Trypanosoma theileri]|uniref:Putative signal peptide peptidase, putative,aspartic peptidase, clan AD, family A22B n=1 Tax=Trypanosoma theileri TaxID=67003 RepID=A0A1X0P170_9TRYP|nr:putative signal peptide peptidase, putative,aspartic peptidase, clan AD, family A22B [Trypanosoma theileri]ORC90160.1 putative signal peptide peptidase, putative,aspartic peptidase, clan AD, family A22B [Trypanosoma theileri]